VTAADRIASWSQPETVAAFASGSANARLMAVAAKARATGATRLIDIGCGAGRNAIPLARDGWSVLGLDLSLPMLDAARRRVRDEHFDPEPAFLLASMDALPADDASADFVVAHGIWNLARSGAEMRAGMREAGRVARPGATLFVFTFSRHTLRPDAQPVPGETFVFTEFSGQPQCFLTEDQLIQELQEAGFRLEPAEPLLEHNRPPDGAARLTRTPVIFEGVFRRR
jgi:ubiquinone/menaquinone biosynthesis C-methylase UbiE